MKRFAKVVAGVLSGLFTVIPFCLMISALLGYSLSLTDYVAFSVICIGFTVLTLVAVLVKKEAFADKVCTVLFAVSLPLSNFNWLFYLYKCEAVYPIVCMLAVFVCVVVINASLIKRTKYKVLLSSLNVTHFICVAFLAVVVLFFSQFSTVDVFKTVKSPDGIRYADVIVVDEGALGGSTVVEVSKKRKLELFLLKFEEKGKRIYIGDWDEHKDIDVFWKNDNCLIVNSSEYIME